MSQVTCQTYVSTQRLFDFLFDNFPRCSMLCDRAFSGPYGAARSVPRYTFGAIRDIASPLQNILTRNP